MSQSAAEGRGYSRHSVSIPEGAGRRDVFRRLARLPGIVVNLIGADGGAVLLSEASLATTLAARPATLTVELLPETTYTALAADKIAVGLRQATALRRLLCERPVAEVMSEVGGFLQHLDQMQMLLEVYCLQRRSPAVTRAWTQLPVLRAQLLASASTYADNVRCMDDLHYTIAPLLEKLGTSFRRS